MVFAVYDSGTLVEYVAASDPKKAIEEVSRRYSLSASVTAVRQRIPPLQHMDKNAICAYLNLQLKVDVDWSRLVKSDLMAIASSVAHLKVRISQLEAGSSSGD